MLEELEIILIADPRILAIPVAECEEPLIDIKNLGKIAYGPSPEIPDNTDYTKMRTTVYQKLLQAEDLLPNGMRFCLYEGFRSWSLQKMLFETRYSRVREHHPHWTDQEIFIEATKLVSPIINLDGSTNVPPHTTGAALDVYLIDDTGNALDMGIHPKDFMEDDDDLLSPTASTNISANAKENRRIMSHALASVGFINYPTEYWHWSYGDRYWAYFKNQPHAIYDTYKQ